MRWLGVASTATGAIIALVQKTPSILSIYLVVLGIFCMTVAILEAVEKRK